MQTKASGFDSKKKERCKGPGDIDKIPKPGIGVSKADL